MTSFITPSPTPQTTHDTPNVSAPEFSIPHSASAPVTLEERDGPAVEKSWLRLVGLPFNATESDILAFVSGFTVGTGAPLVIFAPTRGCRGCDRAFVRMASAAEAHRAEGALHGQYMKSRFIEARRVAMRHVLREIKNVSSQTQVAPPPPPPKVLSGPMFTPAAFRQIQQNLPLPMGHCVTLVGLPWNCPPQSILSFLNFPPVRALHICGNRGDKCIVELPDTNEVARIAKQFHRQHMGGRYIEVYAARPCDMRCACHPGSILVSTPHAGLVPLPMLDMVLAGCLPAQFPIAPAPGFSMVDGRVECVPQQYSVDQRAMSPSGSETFGPTASSTFASVPSFASLSSSATESCQRNNSNETSSDEDDMTAASECKSEEKDDEPYKTGPVFVHDPYSLPVVPFVEELDMDGNSDDNAISEDRAEEQTSVAPPKMSSAEDWAAEEDDDYAYTHPNSAAEEAAVAATEEPKQRDVRSGAASPTNSASSGKSQDNVCGDVEGLGDAGSGSAAHLPAHRSPKHQQRPHLPQGMPGVCPPFGAYFVPPMMIPMPIMPMAMPWPMPVPSASGMYNNGHKEHTHACACQHNGKGSPQPQPSAQ